MFHRQELSYVTCRSIRLSTNCMPSQILESAAYISTHGGKLHHLGKYDEISLLPSAPKGDGMRYGLAACNGMTGRSFYIMERMDGNLSSDS